MEGFQVPQNSVFSSSTSIHVSSSNNELVSSPTSIPVSSSNNDPVVNSIPVLNPPCQSSSTAEPMRSTRTIKKPSYLSDNHTQQVPSLSHTPIVNQVNCTVLTQ